MELKVNAMYRIAHNATKPELRGKPCVLKYLAKTESDLRLFGLDYARRALVYLVTSDGSLGQAYRVTPESLR